MQIEFYGSRLFNAFAALVDQFLNKHPAEKVVLCGRPESYFQLAQKISLSDRIAEVFFDQIAREIPRALIFEEIQFFRVQPCKT